MKTIRIGSGAGYGGDRIEPAVELLEKGNLDYIIFECLAERTVALGQKDRQADPEHGYNQRLAERMAKILPLIYQKRVKMITNMGAANPQAAAIKTAEIARQLGIRGLKIAYVTGDDVWKHLSTYGEYEVLENGKKLSAMEGTLISANAYLGCEGIIRALENNADVIITGRVSDPALTIGPLIYEFGWSCVNNPKQMGQAVLAGHLLECAGQVTGGYYADPGYKEVPDLDKLGFPLVEISDDGTFVVTKVAESGGMVTVDTCKEQTIYEIHNPKAYLTPDAIADFSHVQFSQIGENRVLASGATAAGKPQKLKVTVAYKDCFIGEGEISYGGSNCVERARLAADIVKKRLKQTDVKTEELRTDLIGYNSLYGDHIAKALAATNPPEVRLRVCGRTRTLRAAQQIGEEVETLYTNGPAGGGGARKYAEEVISVCSIFISPKDVEMNVHYLEVSN